MITAILVAAGKSARMGNVNKLHLPFGNGTILETVIQNLLASKIDEIIVVTNEEGLNSRHHNNSKISHVVNHNPEFGLTSSIQIGVEKAKESSVLLVCLADMPLITSNDYNLLIDNYLNVKKKVIIQPFVNDKPGNPVLFSSHFREEIMSLDYPEGCKPVVKSNTAFLQKIKTTNIVYNTDIDTPENYQEVVKNWSN